MTSYKIFLSLLRLLNLTGIKMKATLLILIIISLGTRFINPQAKTWERVNGPYGGFISAIYQSSTGKIYAGGRGLLYSKYSNEENWSLTLRTNPSAAATTIVENSQGKVFASFTAGTYCSTDNGVTWTLLNSGITGAVIDKLTIDDQDNLYTTDKSIKKILKSTDDGLSWNEVYSYSTSPLRVFLI